MSENEMEKTGGDENPKEVDPFTHEIHTGERALERVKYFLEGGINQEHLLDHMQQRAEVFERTGKDTLETYERMLEKLPENEKQAFKLALAEGLKDFYYTHYSALRRRLESEKN